MAMINLTIWKHILGAYHEVGGVAGAWSRQHGPVNSSDETQMGVSGITQKNCSRHTG